MDTYNKLLQTDKDKTLSYYRKSITKTEQQKYLETLLEAENNFVKSRNIADIACGGGTLSYHLANINKNAEFSLVDYNKDAIEEAKKISSENRNRFSFHEDNIYGLNFDDNVFDYTFCWMTLSWIEQPESALNELIRITKQGGKIYLSALFNTDNDCDIYSKVYDNSRKSSETGCFMNYNTYSEYSVKKWISDKVSTFKIHKFMPTIDIEYNGRGVGTNTVKLFDSTRLQISGGILLNWGILEIST